MAKQLHKRLRFPILGLNKSTAYSEGPEFYCADALNFWPTQWQSGRARGGTRCGLDSFGNCGTPRNWSYVTWTASSVTYRGVAIACTDGVYISTGSSFTEAITDSASGTVCSATMFNDYLYYARAGQAVLRRQLTNPGTGSGTDFSASVGTKPPNCGLVSVHQNRLVLAGDTANPHVLYMSREGDPIDFLFSDSDAGAAWATSSTGQAGKIGHAIVALIPHTDNCTIVCGTDAMYVVRGNPTAAGSVYLLSNVIGCLSQAAWCKTANGWTFLLTRDGLYKIPPGCPESHPEPVSRVNLPEELVGLTHDGSTNYVSIGYDPRWIGIHIYADQGATETYYFYDMVKEGFWPMSFGSTLRLAASHPLGASATDSGLLAISSSGAASTFTNQSGESHENIASHLVYGPILLGQQGMEGRLDEVISVLAEDSTAVSWKVYVGNSAAEAYARVAADDAQFTGVAWAVESSWEDGRDRLLQYVQNPLLGGQCCYLKVYASGTSARISVEEIELTMVPNGPRRVM